MFTYFKIVLFFKSLTNTVIGQGLDLVTPPKVTEDSLFDFSNYTQDVYDEFIEINGDPNKYNEQKQ